MGGDCERIRAEFVAYLDGELAEAACAEVETHVRGGPGGEPPGCAACRRELGLLARTGGLLGLMPEPPPGPAPGFERRVARRIAERRRARLIRVALAGAALAASVAVVAGLGLLERLPWASPRDTGAREAAVALDPAAEAEVIANLHVLEALELVENVDLLDEIEAGDDPLLGLDEEGKG